MAGPRVKRYYLKLGFSKKLVISLRRFRTKPENRSQAFPQLVLAINAPKSREIAFAIHGKRRRAKTPKRYANLRRLHNQGVSSLALMTLGFAGIIFCGLNLKTSVSLNLVGSNTASAASVRPVVKAPDPKTLPRSTPLRIQIPKIQVNTSLTPVGLQPSGAVALPDGFDIAGWYSKSPTPGELGPSVIVGHVDSYDGIAVFWRLRELSVGDKIIVSRQDHKTATFKVIALRQFSQKSFPTREVYGNIDYAGLRVITCSGTFSTATQHYDQNIVVYGKLI